MTNPKLGKILSIVGTVFIVLTGIAFIFCTAHLYFTGGSNPYSRESVGKYLSYLALPSIITILFILGGLIYNTVTRTSSEDGFKRSESEMLYGYAKRFDIEKLDEKTRESVIYERNSRFGTKVYFYTITALFTTFAFAYILFIAEFSVENLSSDVIRAFSISLPLVAAGVAALTVCAILCESSAGRERKLLLDAVKNGYKPALPVTEEICDKDVKRAKIVRYVIIGIAVLLIVLGIFNGGMDDVLAKAVKICTECIGLG